MTSFWINPFSWHDGEHISGSVGSLSLTKMNGSVIPVANLTEEIEVTRLSAKNAKSLATVNIKHPKCINLLHFLDSLTKDRGGRG